MNTPQTASPVLYEERGAVALVTLNRPDALNSFTRAMHSALWAALDRAEAADRGCAGRPRSAQGHHHSAVLSAQGFFTGPYQLVSLEEPMANSSMLVLPNITTPEFK